MNALLRAFVRLLFIPLGRLVYRPRALNADRVPNEGGVLLIANHMGYLDALILTLTCPRTPRFVIVSRFMKVKSISWFLDLFGAIPITPGRSRDAIRITAQALTDGELVCLFPEGQLTRTGNLNELKKGFELIARTAGVPVIPAWMQGLWGSIFTFERGVFFHKKPRRLPWPVTVAFGEPKPPQEANVAWARESLMALSAEALGEMRELQESLPRAILRNLRRFPGTPCFVEHGTGEKPPRRLKRHHVLSTVLPLADRWRRTLPEEEREIGVLLPAGATPAVVNLALIFAGRVPVNLPFPATPEGQLDPASVSASLAAAGPGIRTVITSRAFASLLGGITWPGGAEGRFLDMAAEMREGNLVRRLHERLASYLEPCRFAFRRLGLPKYPGTDIAWAGIDESGHRHDLDERAILAQAWRLSSGNWIELDEPIFTEEGLQTPAGAQWSLWLPALRGFSAVGRTWSTRNRENLVESVCSAEKVRRLLISPEMAERLAAIPDPWHPEIRETLRSVLVPAAANGPGRALDALEAIVGALPCGVWAPDQGRHGILAVGQPDPNPDDPEGKLTPQVGRREGSVGRILPGLAFRAHGPETQELRGPGLGDGDSWVELGEPFRLDAEGFVFPVGESPG